MGLAACDGLGDATDSVTSVDTALLSQPEGTSVTLAGARVILNEARANLEDLESMDSVYRSVTNDTALYGTAFAALAEDEEEETETKVSIYCNGVYQVSSRDSGEDEAYYDAYGDLVNESAYEDTVYFSSSYWDTSYEQLEDGSYDYIDVERWGIYSKKTGSSVRDETYAEVLTGYETQAEAINVLKQRSESAALSNSGSHYSMYFDVSSLSNRNSDGFVLADDGLYFTYRGVSRSTITNPYYPGDDTKNVLSTKVEEYVIYYANDGAGYRLSSYSYASKTTVAVDFMGNILDEALVIQSTERTSTFTYTDYFSNYNAGLNLSLSDITVSYRLTTTGGSYSTGTLTDQTDEYWHDVDRSFEGYFYTAPSVSVTNDRMLTIIVDDADTGEEREIKNAHSSVFTVNDRFGKVSTYTVEEGEDVVTYNLLTAGTYAIDVYLNSWHNVTSVTITVLA